MTLPADEWNYGNIRFAMSQKLFTTKGAFYDPGCRNRPWNQWQYCWWSYPMHQAVIEDISSGTEKLCGAKDWPFCHISWTDIEPGRLIWHLPTCSCRSGKRGVTILFFSLKGIKRQLQNVKNYRDSVRQTGRGVPVLLLSRTKRLVERRTKADMNLFCCLTKKSESFSLKKELKIQKSDGTRCRYLTLSSWDNDIIEELKHDI